MASDMRGTLGGLVHPLKLSLLQSVQCTILRNYIGETVLALFLTVETDLLFESPVVGKADSSSVLRQRTEPVIARVELISVGAAYKHVIQSFIGPRFKVIWALNRR